MEQTPLRILYHHRVAASDGMRVHINELVDAMRREGHIVQVVGPGSGAAPTQRGQASTLEQLADRLRAILPAAAFECAELLYNIPAYFSLSRAAKAFKPDVLYERYNLFLLAGLALKRRHRLPMLLEVNSPLAEERTEFGGLQLRSIARQCEAALWRGADLVLPVTEVLAARVRQTRTADAGVHVVPNGANLDARPGAAEVADVRRRFGLADDATVLGFVGFIRAWHGVGWAVEALTTLPRNVQLLIVGDGPARPQLEARAAALGVSARVHFAGRVPHVDVPAYMQCFDIALQTASVSYASPLKLFEYMGLGRAVIAPDQPNIREVLTHGQDALLFEPDSQESFVAALTRMCMDDALRSGLGESALKTVKERPFTWRHNATRIAALARALTAPTDRADGSAIAANAA